MPVERSQLQRMIDKMETALSIMEAQQEARQKILDDECDQELTEELEEGNTFPTAKQPFSDSPPAHIHGQPKRNLFD